MANKSKNPAKRKFPEDAEYTDTTLSFRGSSKLAERMDAAGKMLGMDRSEFIRYALVRLIVDTPDIVANRQTPLGSAIAVVSNGSVLANLPPSNEELLYGLTYDGEMAGNALTKLRKRVEQLEKQAR